MFSTKWLISLLVAMTMQCTMVSVSVAHEVKAENVPGSGGDFTLNSHEGPVSLAALRGKVVLLFFGYTACVDVCPMTLWSLSKVFSSLTAEEMDRVTAMFISLDPERDTPALLQKYTNYFHPNIIGATESGEVLAQLISDYGIAYERKEEPGSTLGYAIYHTPDILVVDAEGYLLDERIPVSASTEEIIAQVRGLLVPVP